MCASHNRRLILLSNAICVDIQVFILDSFFLDGLDPDTDSTLIKIHIYKKKTIPHLIE